MWDSQEQHEQADWEKTWAAMDPASQREVWDRVAVTPFKIVLRPWYVRLSVSPYAFWKHYKLSRKHMGRFHSLRWAFVWTGLLLFPRTTIEGKAYKPNGMVKLAAQFSEQCVKSSAE